MVVTLRNVTCTFVVDLVTFTAISRSLRFVPTSTGFDMLSIGSVSFSHFLVALPLTSQSELLLRSLRCYQRETSQFYVEILVFLAHKLPDMSW